MSLLSDLNLALLSFRNYMMNIFLEIPFKAIINLIPNSNCNIIQKQVNTEAHSNTHTYSISQGTRRSERDNTTL